MSETLYDLRLAYEQETKRSLSMPLAGAFVWLVIAVFGCLLPENRAIVVMLFGTGLIFPVALLIARFRRENLTDRLNPLSRLMGMSVLMVNLLWAVHLPLLLGAPRFFPLSLGIGLGIHWIVYSWIIQHPVGLIHAILRTGLIVSAWSAFPTHRLLAVPVVIVIVYLISLVLMVRRPISASSADVRQHQGEAAVVVD
jgi:hypothetical protein